MMTTRTFTAGGETFEVRPLNAQALTILERNLKQSRIDSNSTEASVELVRTVLTSWVRDGKDLVATLSRENLRNELAQYDLLMVRIVAEAKDLATEMTRRYEEDAKN